MEERSPFKCDVFYFCFFIFYIIYVLYSDIGDARVGCFRKFQTFMELTSLIPQSMDLNGYLNHLIIS